MKPLRITPREALLLKAARELHYAGATEYLWIGRSSEGGIEINSPADALADLNGARINLERVADRLYYNPQRKEKPVLVETLFPNLTRLLDAGGTLRSVLKEITELQEKVTASFRK